MYNKGMGLYEHLTQNLTQPHLSFGNSGNWDIGNKLQNFRSTER